MISNRSLQQVFSLIENANIHPIEKKSILIFLKEGLENKGDYQNNKTKVYGTPPKKNLNY